MLLKDGLVLLSQNFYVMTKEFYKSILSSVVRRWKRFYMWWKFYKKVGKSFAREGKLSMKGRKVVHVDKKKVLHVECKVKEEV